MMKLQEEILKIKNEMIDEFDEKIKALKAEVQREDEFPRNGDEYWFIDEEGSVGSTLYDNHYIDDYYIDRCHQTIGNFFQTKEEAEFAVEKLKVEAELRKFSRPFESRRFNHYIFLDTDSDCLDVDCLSYCQSQGTIHFESGDKAQQAIEAVGEERIKKYIFGVEELNGN